MTKTILIYIGIILGVCLSGLATAQPWTENFDTQAAGTYGTGTITINSRVWTRQDAGNFSYANTNMGSYAFTINDDEPGAHITTPSLNTCGTVSFKYAYINGNSSNVFKLQKSTDGTNFSDLETHTLGASSNLSYVDYSYDVNDASSTVYIRILSDKQNAHLFIEDFSVAAFAASTPTITLSESNITSFNYIEGLGPSSEQTFTVAGSNLTGDISITAPTNYEISTDGTNFYSSRTLTQSGGAVSTTTIHVRLKTGLGVNTYNGTLTAASSGATTKNVSLSGEVTCPSLSAPTATAATSASSTSFNANWNAVSGATGYELDVYQSGNALVETFTSIGGGTTSSYSTRTWTGDGGIGWTAYKARTDQVVNTGNDAICLQNEADAYLISDAISGSITSIEFDVKQVFTGSGGQLTVKVLYGASFTSELTVGTISYSTTASQFSESVTGITGDYKIRIDNNTNARPAIDNLSYGSSTSYVTGYNALDVGNVTSYSVSGLTAGETYYYVVRAYNSCGNESSNSNEIEVTLSCSDPTTQASALNISNVQTNQMDIAWTNGDGDYRLVVASTSAISGTPADNTSYSADAVFNNGQDELNAGEFVVYAGSGNNFTMTGLSSDTEYFIKIFEYNCDSGSEQYLTTSPLSGNETTAAIPNITLSSSNPASTTANILADSDVDNNVIYAFDLSVNTFDAILTEFDFTTSGTYVASNITNFKAWYSSDATFNTGSDTQLDNLTSSLDVGTHTFTGFNQTIANGNTGYIFITADLPCGATDGNTIQVSAITTADLTFTSGNKSGTAYTGGTKTITSAMPNNVTALSTANCENGGVDLSWTAAAGCSDNVIVVASPTVLTTAPSGTGISYTANPIYGSGTAYNGGYVVYKGTETSVSISGLTNGTNYTYTVFTRNDLNWSAGVEVDCTPSLVYCDPGTWSAIDSEIERVVLTGENNSINNVTTNTCTNSIQDETAMSADLNQGDSYTLTVEFGDCNGETQYDGAGGVWIDWNGDGDFDDTGEEIVTVDVAVSSGNVIENFTINVPAAQALGNYRMRIVQDEGANEASIDPCTSPGYGTIVDYTIEVISPCIPTHTVSSFTPTSGPVGTEVIVTGTGFTASTSAEVNGASATIVSQTATKLIVKIPSGASTGNIVITESACYVNAGAFTVLDGSGSCTGSSNFTDIIISEVYDADALNVVNVELYNPTVSAIDLTNYTLEFYYNGSSSSGRSVDITGTISPGDTYLTQLGTSSNTCNSVTYDFIDGGSGINGDDDIRLYNGSTEVDEWLGETNQTGFSVTRKGTAVGPTTTYDASDWDISLVESCNDLGVAPVSAVPPPTVSVLSDYNSCELDLSVTASSGDGGTLTYQWYYTDNVSTGWTAVSSSSPAGLTIVGEDSDNLIITTNTNSTTTIDDYQFYVEVTEDGACSNISNAARYSVDGETYFRSTGTGNWNDLSSWEMSTSTSGPWINACIVPNDVNSDYVSVENGHTISVVEGVGTPDLTINQLTVQEGGIFRIEESAEVEISNGAVGADVVVLGTLRDEGSSAGNGIGFLSSATWELGANGTIIKTHNSSINEYRDKYETGINNIPATADWAFVYTGQGAVSTTAVEMFYPNLHFESTSGNYDAASLAEALTGGSGGFVTVKGDLNIGVGSITGGTGTYKVYNNNINSTPMLVLGDVYIEAGSELTNDSYDGSTTTGRGDGTGIEVKGDMLIDGTLDNTHGTGLLKLSGISKQDIVSSGTGSLLTYDFELDNSNHTELDDIDLEINNELTFTAGKIITDIATTDKVWLKNTSTSAIQNHSTTSYINGNLRRAVAATGSYDLPVGDASNYQLASIDLNSSTGLTYFDTKFNSFSESLDITALGLQVNGTTIQTLLDGGYWTISPNAGMNAVNYDIGLNLVGTSNAGADPAQHTVVKRTNSSSEWELNGSHNNADQTISGGVVYVYRSGITSFSDFAIAKHDENILPVEMLYFEANCENGVNQLLWATASEINSDYFEIQKSIDANSWESLGIVNAAGFSNSLIRYYFEDRNSNKFKYVYYRLKQVDFDGSFSYSKIILVEADNGWNDNLRIQLSQDNYLYVWGTNNEINNYYISDILGRKLITGTTNSFNDEAYHTINTSELTAGTYIIVFYNKRDKQSFKFIIP